MGLDGVVDYLGSGVASLGVVEELAENGLGAGAAGCRKGVQANLRPAIGAARVAGGAKSLPKWGWAVIGGAITDEKQKTGHGGLRVVGARAQGVGEPLALSPQQPHRRMYLCGRDLVGSVLPLGLQAPDYLPCPDHLLPGWSTCQYG